MLDIGLISIEKKDYIKLRNEIEHWKSAYNSAIETGNMLLAHEKSVFNEEIERLRADHNDGVALTMAEHLICELNGEVERLRMELTKVGNGSYNPALVLAERDVEIERLRSENERLWSLCRNVYGSDRFIREALGEKTE